VEATVVSEIAASVLSARESEVARLYAEGQSHKLIARTLAIAPGTVRSHLNTIYRKLEVTNRIELLRRLEVPAAAAAMTETAAAADTPPRAGPERRQLTVLFADLVGSTTLAAGLDAEDMHELLLAYRAAAAAEIERFGGHVAGLPGDGVVACFGWPRALEDAAERAVRAGLALTAAVARIATPGGGSLAVRVGIATGIVVVDSASGSAESLTGGTPNLAARLQTLAGPAGVVVAAATRELVGDLFRMEILGEQLLHGLPEPVAAFRVLGERADVSRFEALHSLRPTAMVGRDHELALLGERWQRAVEGEGQAVLLLGEPGIGKSRLASALIETVGEAAAVLRFQTSPQQGDSPLWPIRRWLRAAAGLDEAADDAARRARFEAFLGQAGGLLGQAGGKPDQALPLVADLLDLPPLGTPMAALPAMSAERRRERLLEVLTDHILGRARQQPVLILFEDLHWIDPTSLALIERVLGQIEAARVLLLMTSRPDGEPGLSPLPHLARISLSRLPRTAAAAIVAGRAGAATLAPGTVAAILARGDGVPLYIEEMTAAMVEGGGGLVPTTLQDSLMARLDRLGAAKETAQIAAVIGREFDHELLAAVAGGGAGLEASVARLIEAGLVFRRGARLSFKHILVQEAAYQSLLRGRRAALHGRIAEALLGRFPARVAAEPETLAQHLEHAGRTRAAIDYYARAADLANHRGANPEARQYLERALGLIASLPAGPERDRREVAALTALGRIMVALVGHAGTAEVYGRALERCRAAGLGLAEFPIVLGLAVQAAVAGDEHRALDLARRLRSLADDSDDPAYDVEAHYALGITHAWRGELVPALRHLEAGERHYAIDQHPRHLAIFGQDPGVVCRCRAGAVLLAMGRPATAAGKLEAAAELAFELGHSFSINYVLNWQAHQAVALGDPVAAERAVARTLAHAEEQGFSIWLTMGGVARAHCLLEHGAPEAALEAAETALERLRATHVGCMTGAVLSFRGEALRRLGRHAAGMAAHEAAMAANRTMATGWHAVDGLRLAARCRREAGNAGEAEALLRRAVALGQEQAAHLLVLRAANELAPLLRDEGRGEEAAALLRPALAAIAEPAPIPDMTTAETLLTNSPE